MEDRQKCNRDGAHLDELLGAAETEQIHLPALEGAA